MKRNQLARRLSAAAVAAIAALACVSLFATPANADSLPTAGCITACTATFTTAGAPLTFAIPVGVSSLTATVAGGAGAAPSFAITADPTAVGGGGGVSTVALGTSYSGQTMTFGVGGAGEGSYLDASATLLAVAGGGGGGGYAGYLDLPGQILATYAGGDGGAPSAAGVAPGASGAAFGSLAANGGGGSASAGGAGLGDANGSAGGSTTVVTGAGSTLAAGGSGGSLLVGTTTHVAGDGGSGYTGGGGGAVERNVPNGDVAADVVAPGGGGSGYLDASLTATAGAPNAGGGYVSFTWSYSPTISTTVTTAHPGDTVPVAITGLPANTAFTVVFDGTTVVSGTSDSTGASSESFSVPGGQAAGSFPLRLVVGGNTVATSTSITVIGAVLALTGSTSTALPEALAVLLIVAGAAVLLLGRRRFRPRGTTP